LFAFVFINPTRAQDHELIGPTDTYAISAQNHGYGINPGWSMYQPSPPTFLLGVGGAQTTYGSQRVYANGYGMVRYGFASMEVSGTVENGVSSLNGQARAGAELRFRDRLFVESPTLPDGSIVTVKIVAVTTRGTRIIHTGYFSGSTTSVVSPYGYYTLSYSVGTTNGGLMHGRELTQADGSVYRIWITNAMVGGSIFLAGSVAPNATITVYPSQNKSYESAKDQCSVFITARSLDTNVTLTSASGAVYPPEDTQGIEVIPYGTNEYLIAAPAGMLLQTVSGLSDNADWSNASSNLITRLNFTNNAGFFRAAAP
jgi:hypothetical protein